MKKQYVLITAGILGLSLAGCKDASARLSNGNELIFKVENEKVTNEDIYAPLMNASGFTVVNADVENVIFDKEVTVSDAMKKEADKQLAEEKKKLGDNFESTIKQYYAPYGVSNEKDFYEKILLAGEKRKALTKKYLEEHAQDQINTYKPTKVQIVVTNNEDKAKKALEAIKNGSSFEAAAKSFGVTDTYNGSVQIVNQSSKLPSAVWAKISATTENNKLIDEIINDPSSSSSEPMFYIVKIVNKNALEEFKEEALNSIIKDSSSATSDAMVFYLKKYNFHIYDIGIYNSYKTNNPSYIVQE